MRRYVVAGLIALAIIAGALGNVVPALAETSWASDWWG